MNGFEQQTREENAVIKIESYTPLILTRRQLRAKQRGAYEFEPKQMSMESHADYKNRQPLSSWWDFM